MYKIKNNYRDMYNNIVVETKTYLKNNPAIKALVIGISGGIDSALTAVIARNIVDYTNTRLIGYSIPIETNTEVEIIRAKQVGKAFCNEFHEVNWLARPFRAFVGQKESKLSKAEKIRRGNIKARIRMIFLYDQAHRANGMVLSTDNYTELMLGYWTLHGDVGDYGMLQNLWKTEVYGLARWMADKYTGPQFEALDNCIRATPTDGLGITSSDLEDIQADSYREVDDILITHMNNHEDTFADHPVIKRHIATQFKRMNPVNIPRNNIVISDRNIRSQ